MFMSRIVLVLVLVNICELCSGANILAAVPSPFYSHEATFMPLWKQLAKRGHKITLISLHPLEHNENITRIDFRDEDSSHTKKIIMEDLNGRFAIINMMAKFMNKLQKLIMDQFTKPALINLLESETKFDLLFIELFPPWAALSCKFNIPYIQLSTMNAMSFNHEAMGNAIHPAIFPSANFGYEVPLSFRERLMSTGEVIFFKIVISLILPWFADPYVEKYITHDCPLGSIARNASLLFLNENPIFFDTRPSTPKTINLGGGIHLLEPKKLPEDLQTFLDGSENGLIYFSLGSSVDTKTLTPEIVEVFRQTFEDLAPVRVLWKFENDTLSNMPKNLKIEKWLPQQDILRHPNVKLFITQGGLQSMEEAIEYAVPMLGIPFHGDQFNNVNKMAKKQFGIKLDIKNLDRVSLKKAINELLNNPIYKKNAEKYSRMQKDQPMRALDTAVWWTEYVIRHGGTDHLKSPSEDIPLYQYFFLDIIAFVVVVLLFVFLLSYYLFKLMRYLLRNILMILKIKFLKKLKSH